jgi:hypothetical protein
MPRKIIWVLTFLAFVFGAGACTGSSTEGSAKRPSRADEAFAASVPVARQILVDQFGYLPRDPKVAVVRNPQAGFDTNQSFHPGLRYELRRARDGTAVFSGTLKPWNEGAREASSGDIGWWFDFSSVSTPDRYFVYDTERKLRSPTFSIGDGVYRDVLKAAMRMYYYQRSGIAKHSPFADPCWNDEAAYVGPNQDREAHDVTDRDNPAKVRDLSGGWFDAGDTNKYVTFAAQPVHQLLTAYQEHPHAFGDDFNIPESGNGIPDVIDEVKLEIDWLKKMQYPDGSVALKVGAITQANPSPPSSDRLPRFYVPACSSATIATAGMFAHAALVFDKFPPLQRYAADLRARAERAWTNYQGISPKQTSCDTGVVLSGRADWSEQDQAAYAAEAAIYLFATTGDSSYQDYVRQHYRETRPYRDMGWSRYQPDQGESLLFYSALPNADPALSRTIREDKTRDARSGNHVYGFEPRDDLYRAYMHDEQYHWGSNNQRANYGNSNLDAVTYGGDSGADYRLRALEILHYFHGVNPFGMTYITNMYSLGATRSANEIFHTWFQNKTRWSDALESECGPPPGYIPGGPNASAEKSGVPALLSPPTGQPPQKSYRDWNVGWPESSWAITEPGIYYQGAYVKLLSAFVP